MTNLVDCTNTLDLKYDRGPDGYGVPVDKDIRFKGDIKLKEALDEVRLALQVKLRWWEHIDHFLTAGLYVDKKGAHGKGLAWDFDGVILKPNPITDVFIPFSLQKVWVYKADVDRTFEGGIIRSLHPRIRTRFDCLMSLRFGVVLTQGYPGHADHGHYDLSREVKWWGNSKSQVILLQETLNAWFDAGLVVDGEYGRKTKAAWKRTEGTNKPISEQWWDWLKMIAFDPPEATNG